jgi:hypothetical protein
VTEQRSWPQRFLVTIVGQDRCRTEYGVTTWLSREKAVALAVGAHARRTNGLDETDVYDVEVVDAGRVPADSQGLPAVPGKDIIDRYEF